MIVDIRGQGFMVTPALAEHVRRRLGFVLTRHSDRIQRIAVRFGDANGTRGEIDKSCRIQVHLTDAQVAAITHVGADLYAVIDRAVDRVGRVVVKHLVTTHHLRDVGRWHEPGKRPVEPAGRPP